MIVVKILERATSFAEDKDIAAQIQKDEIRPALARGETVRLDFRGVDGATQSFIHAMISELIRSLGSVVLKKIEFKSCSPTIRSIVEIVTEYSQLDETEIGGTTVTRVRKKASGKPKAAPQRRRRRS